MNKILLIIQREYSTRVRKRSFIIMSVLSPLLIAAFYGLAFLFAISDSDQKQLLVLDESGIFYNRLKNTPSLTFEYTKEPFPQAKQHFLKQGYYAFLHVPQMTIDTLRQVLIYAEQSISFEIENDIKNLIEKEVEKAKLIAQGIDIQVLQSAKTDIALKVRQLLEKGEKDSHSLVLTGIGFVSGFLIYFFVFIYGVQMMRGVLEEKTSRVVEVVISSVKPFQLMLGKIIGIAGVGLTQIIIWIVLGTLALSTVGVIAGADKNQATALQPVQTTAQQAPVSDMANILQIVNSIDIPLLLFGFVFYFLFGYLLYAALFSAVGAAVDNETDTQQFMLPITLPIVFAITVSSVIIREPSGTLAFCLSVIPITSPVVMMVRLPFIGFGWELMLSMSVLITSFVLAVWVAARIYRVGILMHGKKPSYKDLVKWVLMS